MTEYNELTPELISQLQAIVGEEDCHVGENISEDYSHDEMPIYGTKMPEAVCFPGNTEEVAAIMKLCNENKIPVTVRGAGTGLVGGSTPLQGGVVLCTMHMNEILEYDMNNLFVRVQPGVRLCDLAADALEHDLMYPPDPGEKTGSLGGNVSTNAGGMRAVKYGTTRDYVLAMTVVLPTGEIMEIGRAGSKTSSGYSLLHLMIGSEGTLGVITELTLKLIPVPKEDISFILPFEDLETAISAVPKIKLAGLDPQSIEFMERDIVDSSADYTGNKIIPTNVDGHEVGAYILVTLDGNDQDEIFQRAETLAEIGDRAFYDCKRLNAFHLPSGLKKVGTQAFYFCPLTDQPFPESLEFIAEAAFFRCAFTSVVLPRSVTYIGDHAFHGSNTLKYLEFHHDPDFIGADIANKITVIRCYEGSKVDTYCKEYGYQTEYL